MSPLPTTTATRCAPHGERDHLDAATTTFAGLRPRLLAIARRILGRGAEAEDVVQDAWIRWQTCDRNRVDNATAFLVTTTTRLALNTLASARVRRELSVARWSPEPADASSDPADALTQQEDLERGLLVLLERLTESERTAFVLRKAFGYSYDHIAAVLDTSPPNVRQLVSRAGVHLASVPSPSRTTRDHARVLRAFVGAARWGETGALERVLSGAVRAERSTEIRRDPMPAGFPALAAS